ncbi:hypothetical protein SUGI_0319310 [Cryptomeria japonica]|nr:hypothetical protein SUGI_0319310 [Cryptomeria japonica]
MEKVWSFKQTNKHRLKDERLQRRDVVWQAPPLGWMKLNFDRASKGNPGRSGLGAIVKDEFGFTLKYFLGPVGFATNNVAEISALEGQEAIVALVQDALSEERHWCDSHIYEIVLCLLVDVKPSKEVVVEKISRFVRECVTEAVGSVVMEVEEEWASILGPFFNPGCLLSKVEVSDSEDEEQVAAIELQKKENFMATTWEVFHVGVINVRFTVFHRMMEDDLGWLSGNSIDKVVVIGERVSTIVRLI